MKKIALLLVLLSILAFRATDDPYSILQYVYDSVQDGKVLTIQNNTLVPSDVFPLLDMNQFVSNIPANNRLVKYSDDKLGVFNPPPDIQAGTGSKTVFSLSTSPIPSFELHVWVDGVKQYEGVHFASSTTNIVTFFTAPPAGAIVEFDLD